MSDRAPVRRSALFMPGSNSRALAKARTLPTDVVIMDLEDAVAPTAKADARKMVAEALRTADFGEQEVVVRCNAIDSPWFADDVAAIAPLQPDALLLPKVEDVTTVERALAATDAAAPGTRLALWVMIETPRGVLGAAEICAASPQLGCLVAGTSDLAKELRVPPARGRPGLVHALGTCVLAARAAGIDALDGVELDLTDEEGFEAVCAEGRALGFDGKTLIHPRQIAPCNAAFGPTPAAVSAAKAVIDAHGAAERAGAGVVVVAGRLVENLHVEEARRTLALAEAIARREGR